MYPNDIEYAHTHIIYRNLLLEPDLWSIFNCKQEMSGQKRESFYYDIVIAKVLMK